MAVIYKHKHFRVECRRFAERYPEHESLHLLAEGEAIIDELEAELAELQAHLDNARRPYLAQHDDGRYALALGDVARRRLTDGDPGWHRVPLDVVAAGEDPPGLGALSQDYLDACRFRLLTNDYGDREVRDQVRHIIERLPVMSYAAACRDLDEVFRNKAKATGAQEESR